MSQMTLRLPDSLHRRAKLLAQQDHVSLNTMITVALAEKISILSNENPLEERAKRGSQLKFEDVMSAVPDVEPPDYDKL
jgi:predicted transcriptional regulator